MIFKIVGDWKKTFVYEVRIIDPSNSVNNTTLCLSLCCYWLFSVVLIVAIVGIDLIWWFPSLVVSAVDFYSQGCDNFLQLCFSFGSNSFVFMIVLPPSALFFFCFLSIICYGCTFQIRGTRCLTFQASFLSSPQILTTGQSIILYRRTGCRQRPII